MFNPLHLLQVSIVSMGVANTTPICNDTKEETPILTTKKNQNIVNNYEITLQATTFEQHSYTITNVQGQNTVNGNDYERKVNTEASSNYINVLGTYYNTNISKWDADYNNDIGLVQNNRTLSSDTTGYYEKCTRMIYVLQIDPYNYNINTETNIQLTFNIAGFTAEDQNFGQYQRILQNKYFIRNVYQTIQSNWSQYLNRQMTSLQAYNIIAQVENVNNGFYYTKNTNKFEVTANTDTDVVELSMTPNKTNYYIIEYIPTVNMAIQYTGSSQENITSGDTIPCKINDIWVDSIKITGTNIIPDGTYEVIDIPGLMWEILTMPFAFVSQAFNLTLFPGTPYQINIANLFLSLIAIFVFVWLIGFFLKMKG